MCFGNGAIAFQGDLNAQAEVLTPFIDGVDVLYHCAAELRDEAKMRETNVNGTSNLLEISRGKIGKWVQLSSTGVYGKPRGDFVVDEDFPLNPGNRYELTKLESDHLILDATAQGYFNSVIIRPSNVYGMGMANQSLFQLISMVYRGLFFYIGKPGALASYIHVNNVVDALHLAALSDSHRPGGVYIVSDQVPIESLVGEIAKALEVRSPKLRIPEFLMRLCASVFCLIPGFPLTASRIDALTTRVAYSTKRISADLGYQHGISIQQGISELASYWKSTLSEQI